MRWGKPNKSVTRKKLLKAADHFWECLAYKEDLSFEKWDIKLRVEFDPHFDYLGDVYLWNNNSWCFCYGGSKDLFLVDLLRCRDREEAINLLRRRTWIRILGGNAILKFDEEYSV